MHWPPPSPRHSELRFAGAGARPSSRRAASGGAIALGETALIHAQPSLRSRGEVPLNDQRTPPCTNAPHHDHGDRAGTAQSLARAPTANRHATTLWDFPRGHRPAPHAGPPQGEDGAPTPPGEAPRGGSGDPARAAVIRRPDRRSGTTSATDSGGCIVAAGSIPVAARHAGFPGASVTSPSSPISVKTNPVCAAAHLMNV